MSINKTEIGTLNRSSTILRLLATAGKRGLALTDIASRSALPHGTVHRLLKQLGDTGLTFQSEESRRYLLGPVAYELGLAATEIFDFRSLCRPALERLCQESEATAYFIMRSGYDAVCIDRIEGPFSTRTISLDIGSRRPLGVGAGGLAILAACADDECERILEATASRLGQFHHLNLDQQRQAIQETKKQNYSLIRNRLTLGVTALGMTFRDSMRRPIGAISIGTIDSRLKEPRRKIIVELLKQQVLLIEKSMRASRRVLIEHF
ncbi:IclR family transcriptional regulator [Pseudomonas extremaustralis]|jgi:DNA-binding IclR family transcriptional regulator|uniref:IclR family transcriptional regulator n=1 Tax=Pseudomonas extremaustralis TaxID=359110 RepID=UPI0023DFA7EC|nr:IclR family transcriptional regulator [Pseudomonas extremaustralis]MDF3134546.1 IclR family transcriptional regulator [Pseudomonas extremaustralis]